MTDCDSVRERGKAQIGEERSGRGHATDDTQQGIGERGDIYAPAPEGPEGWPARPNTLTLDVDMNGVVWTAYLALHFLRKNPSKGGWLVMTASSAALYPSGSIPLYAVAKHGVSLEAISRTRCSNLPLTRRTRSSGSPAPWARCSSCAASPSA